GVARSLTWNFTSADPAPVCRLTRGGVVVSADAPCSGTVGYDISGDPDDTYTVTVTESAGAATTSDYVLDTTAPAITSAPAAVSSDRNPAWSFSGGNGTRSVCTLTGPATSQTVDPCPSPAAFNLAGADGDYTFTVWSADGSDISASSTSLHRLLTSTPPAPTVSSPPSTGSDPRPTWTFGVP